MLNLHKIIKSNLGNYTYNPVIHKPIIAFYTKNNKGQLNESLGIQINKVRED